MEQISFKNFSAFLAKAEKGTAFSAQIFSIKGGGLRVTCDWLYSALNIDPNDISGFLWEVKKIDDSHVSLSPRNTCTSKPIYASVRDDYSWNIQVQAAHSADWITAVQRNETIEMEIGDLMMATFKGFNGKYFKRDASVTSHDGYSAYKIKSVGDNEDENTTWFLSINEIYSEKHEWVGGNIEMEQLKSTLDNKNIQLEKEELEALHKVCNSYENSY